MKKKKLLVVLSVCFLACAAVAGYVVNETDAPPVVAQSSEENAALTASGGAGVTPAVEPLSEENAELTTSGEADAPPVAEQLKVDVDLTALSSTMVFGELFNMMMKPEQYLGKTVKMRGAYASTRSETTGNDYHFVVISDAAACCQQGMEFMLEGAEVPDDYPAKDARIEVAGVYDSYMVGEYVHYYVKTNEISIP